MKKSVTLSGQPASSENATETSPLVSKSPEAGGSSASAGSAAGVVGLSMGTAALLMIGEMVGGGVLALPRALVRMGWSGLAIIALLALIAGFNTKRLADCWIHLEESKSEARTGKRSPYAIIATEALGKFTGVVVSVMMLATQMGASVVYILMATQIIEKILLTLVPTLTYCTWYLIVAGCATPLMIMGAQRNSGIIGSLAFYTVLVACLVYFIQFMFEIRPFVFRFGAHGILDYSLSFGTVNFAFAGVTTFPTILGDMKDRNEFGRSLKWSFAITTILYMLIAAGGYYVYGESVAANVAMSLTASPLTLAGHVLMAINLVVAFILLIQPVCQEFDDLFSVGKDSAFYGFIVRISVMAAVIFIGETIPRFYTILGLIGATSIALVTFILPPIFYLVIFKDSAELTNESKWLCYMAAGIAAAMGVMATIANVGAILDTSLIKPCYL